MRLLLGLQFLVFIPLLCDTKVLRFYQNHDDYSQLLNKVRKSPHIPYCPDKWPLPQHEDPEIYENVCQIAKSYGYPCEPHEVVTEDGYILTLFRIPYGKNSTAKQRYASPRPPIFLQHGLLDSAYTWADNPANESAAFVFADAGYDVWLGNSRGNTFSKRHKHLTPDEDAFWDFTWDDMAEYDLPACVDYVLQVNGRPKLYYVGHSQGTMIAFARLSTDQELASKIEHFFALGPVTNVSHIESPIRMLIPFANTITDILRFIGHGEFLPSNIVLRFLARFLCSERYTEAICSNIVFLLCGYDCKYTNETRLPVYVAHTPAGTSVKNIVHYIQAVKKGQFQKFDYGSKENMKRYNQTTPPHYDVNKITVPISLYWGGIDWLADPTDVRLLIPRLSTVKNNVFISDYNHLDFVWGYNAKDFVYDKILKEIQGGH